MFDHSVSRPAVRTSRRLLSGAALLLAACASDPVSAAPDALALVQLNRDLSALQTAMTRHHRFEFARDTAEYNFLFMDMCMVDDSQKNEGGMGLHYVNLGLLDTTLDVTKPEALLYEPGVDGKLELVAVEYAIPAAAWTNPQPPVLFGQELKVNSFGLYALHVWVWKNNPSGLFASWNPRVSCANWSAAHTGGHH